MRRRRLTNKIKRKIQRKMPVGQGGSQMYKRRKK